MVPPPRWVIRARSVRGKIGDTWWSTRFIEVLESFGMGSRLTRGRNYARRGQVLSLNLDAGLVTASVQGSRATPYRDRSGITAYGKTNGPASKNGALDELPPIDVMVGKPPLADLLRPTYAPSPRSTTAARNCARKPNAKALRRGA